MQRRYCIIAALVVAASWRAPNVLAQQKQGYPPGKVDIRSPGEQAGYDKAVCVFRGLTEAGKALPPKAAPRKMPTADMRERGRLALQQLAKDSKSAVKACLSEQEVFELGRYSFMEAVAFAAGSGCRMTKAPAERFKRTPNNLDANIVNSAMKWDDMRERGPLLAHPFFRGQIEAREQFQGKNRRGAVCQAIVAEFGPNGSRFPGLVRGK